MQASVISVGNLSKIYRLEPQTFGLIDLFSTTVLAFNLVISRELGLFTILK